MQTLTLDAWGHKNGYLQMDTSAFIAERGEHDERLSEALTRYIAKETTHGYATEESVVDWARKVNDGNDPSGLYGDGTSWSFATCNADNFLSQDISVVLVETDTVGTLCVVTGYGYYNTGNPDVYRCYDDGDAMTSWADYARAYGSCENNHVWDVDDTIHMYSDGCYSRDAKRVDDQVRVPFGDRSRAYVACPECGKAVHFSN